MPDSISPAPISPALKTPSAPTPASMKLSSMTPQQKIAQLRHEAEERLRNGTAPLARVGTVSAEALGVLYRLASVPDTGGEGLKLLHELQTYQVELDMQHEQLQANERASAQDLSCYKALFDMAPCGCFILSPAGVITDCNLTGANLLGSVKLELCGRLIHTFITAASQPALAAALDKLHSDSVHASLGTALTVTTEAGAAGLRSVSLSARLSPDREAILLIMTASVPSPL